MPFMDAQTGRMTFLDGLSLYSGMPAQEINERFQNPIERDITLCLKERPVEGGSLAPVCVLDAHGLRCVTLYAHSPAGRQDAGADRQRAFLFAVLRLKDPCPDTRRAVKVRCAFGTVLIDTEPYTGVAAARLEYSRKAAI